LGAGTASAATPSTLPTVSVTINPSAISVSGSLQSGAVNVVTTATGLKEPAAVLFLLKPGVSVAEFEAYLASKQSGDPNYAAKYGTIVFDDEAAGGKGEAQTVLQPGEYVALNAEGEKASTWKHTSFFVSTSAAPAALPTPEATVSSIEFGFRGPAKLHDGELVRFENEGFLVHMDIAFPVKSRRAARKAARLLLAGKEKPLKKLIAGAPVTFIGPVSTGGFQQETISAKPGWYVQVCFMSTQDGRSHTRLGMERIIQITG
jgi:hypothetical protein